LTLGIGRLSIHDGLIVVALVKGRDYRSGALQLTPRVPISTHAWDERSQIMPVMRSLVASCIMPDMRG
jgi:hypothetical protein